MATKSRRTTRLEVSDENKELANQIDKLLNSFSGDRRIPEAFAQKMADTHRTLQSCWMRMLLTTIIRYAVIYEEENGPHTDARNVHAIRIANHIRELHRDGKLGLPFI